MTGAELFVIAAPAALRAIDLLMESMERAGHISRVRANHDIATMKVAAMLEFYVALEEGEGEEK